MKTTIYVCMLVEEYRERKKSSTKAGTSSSRTLFSFFCSNIQREGKFELNWNEAHTA
jgi:hypothetical protein